MEVKFVGYSPYMVTKVDDRRRVVLPKPAREGEVFQVDTVGTGNYLLTRLEVATGQYKLARKHGYLMIMTEKLPTAEDIENALVDFP
jgi:bifunctional DNA-binding transcriptional regulator/antitoxin component of YhaV-PrlF toxin-antitoxin module